MALGRFRGKTVIVTGGASGIGAAICTRLDSEGAKIVVADVNIAQAEAKAASLSSAFAVQVDVTKEAEVEALVKAAIAWSGRLDVMINNAGIHIVGTVDAFSEADLDKILAVNVKGVAFGTKHAAQAMKKNGGTDTTSCGAIVNTSSELSFIAEEGSALYCMTKGAVTQLTRASALDLGPYGIRVNAVCPGLTKTPMADQITEAVSAQGMGLSETTFARAVIKREGRPEEIAAAVAFLASDDATFCTGTLLVADGGRICF